MTNISDSYIDGSIYALLVSAIADLRIYKNYNQILLGFHNNCPQLKKGEVKEQVKAEVRIFDKCAPDGDIKENIIAKTCELLEIPVGSIKNTIDIDIFNSTLKKIKKEGRKLIFALTSVVLILSDTGIAPPAVWASVPLKHNSPETLAIKQIETNLNTKVNIIQIYDKKTINSDLQNTGSNIELTTDEEICHLQQKNRTNEWEKQNKVIPIPRFVITPETWSNKSEITRYKKLLESTIIKVQRRLDKLGLKSAKPVLVFIGVPKEYNDIGATVTLGTPISDEFKIYLQEYLFDMRSTNMEHNLEVALTHAFIHTIQIQNKKDNDASYKELYGAGNWGHSYDFQKIAVQIDKLALEEGENLGVSNKYLPRKTDADTLSILSWNRNENIDIFRTSNNYNRVAAYYKHSGRGLVDVTDSLFWEGPDKLFTSEEITEINQITSERIALAVKQQNLISEEEQINRYKTAKLEYANSIKECTRLYDIADSYKDMNYIVPKGLKKEIDKANSIYETTKLNMIMESYRTGVKDVYTNLHNIQDKTVALVKQNNFIPNVIR